MVFQTSPLVPVTPLKVYLRDHFATVLQQSRPAKRRQKGQVKPREYGEVLTADEVYERIEKEEEERKKKKREKKTQKHTQGSATEKRKQRGQQKDREDEEQESDHGSLDFYMYM